MSDQPALQKLGTGCLGIDYSENRLAHRVEATSTRRPSASALARWTEAIVEMGFAGRGRAP